MRRLDVDDLRRVIADTGRLIVAGPLNNAYEVTIDGERLFVRERVVVDEDYGQQFAAERHVLALLREAVRIPRLEQVIADHRGDERYAIFQFVDGAPPTWSDAHAIEALADILAAIHAMPGRRLGNITGPFSDLPPGGYIAGLLRAEASRLASDPRFARTVEHFAETLTVFDDEPIVLCHGDVHHGNFLRGADGRLWTLDWEACRFRVAAADFNQITFRWMAPEQETSLLDAYCDRTGRSRGLLVEQIRALRVLWFVRTFNFHVNVLKQDAGRNDEYLVGAQKVLS